MNAATDTRYLLTLQDRFTIEQGRVYLNGTQALLRLMLDQRRADQRNGLNTAGFVTGYPGSPLQAVDGVMLSNKQLLEENHVVFRPGLNEELAVTALWGSQTLQTVPNPKYDGVFGLWYGKALGVDRAGDALHLANFRGIGRHGGVLIAAGDDPHARSTAYPTDTTLTFASFYMPVLAPGNVQEIIDLGRHGYAMSRASGLWIGFKVVNDVIEATGIVETAPDRIQPIVPDVFFEGQRVEARLMMNTVASAMLEHERRIYEGQLEVVRQYARLNGINRITSNPPGARIGLMTVGKNYYDLREALLMLGLDDAALQRLGIRILKMGMVYPIEPTIVREFADGLDEIFVIEDKRPYLEIALRDILYSLASRPVIIGKRDDNDRQLLPVQGELSAAVIANALHGRLIARGLTVPNPPRTATVASLVAPKPLPPRVAYFCSGCPHNRGLHVPKGSIVGGGTGCHGMSMAYDAFGPVLGFTQMGGEGAQWIGVAPFTNTAHFFQNIGDGTYHHSGSLAVRAAIAAGVNMTYKILYNSAIGMTGGQNVTGILTVSELAQEVALEGARRVIVTTDEPERYPSGKAGNAEVWHRDRLLEAETLLAGVPGVTVLIHDQYCAAEKRRLRKRGKLADRPKAAYINTRVCEGCGDCGVKSNCLSVQPVPTEFGRKTQIHQSSCNQDFSCMDGDCPSFLTVRTLDGKRPRPGRKQAIEFPHDVVLSDPKQTIDRPYNIVLIGIGGTGVVTVNQVLGTAAFMDGLRVQTYDNTGFSQKAGPVVAHFKIMPDGEAVAPTLSPHTADLYIGFDVLGASNPANLMLASPERTVALISTSAVPTGIMVSKVASQFPATSELRQRIDAVTKPEGNVYLDVQAMAERLLGDNLAANLMLIGMAYQMGLMPMSAQAIETAIQLNATSVKMNLQAFRWGRLHVADPARIQQLLDAATPQRTELPESVAKFVTECVPGLAVGSELHRVLTIRTAELIAFQNRDYARRYLNYVARTRARRPQDEALAVAVARNLYKLMAYKDEYEVARLHLDSIAQAQLDQAFSEKVRIAWNFHPTFLRSLGVKKKVQLGGWFRPFLYLLRGMKFLRGTPFDLLGQTQVRRIERALPGFYESLLDAALARDENTGADLLALAETPDVVRGYEHVKLGNVSKFMAEVSALQRKLGIQVQAPGILADQLPAPVPTVQASAA